MSEPCKHERAAIEFIAAHHAVLAGDLEFAGTQLDTLTSFITTNAELVKKQMVYDVALATLKRLSALAARYDTEGQDVPVSVLREALEVIA